MGKARKGIGPSSEKSLFRQSINCSRYTEPHSLNVCCTHPFISLTSTSVESFIDLFAHQIVGVGFTKRPCPLLATPVFLRGGEFQLLEETGPNYLHLLIMTVAVLDNALSLLEVDRCIGVV